MMTSHLQLRRTLNAMAFGAICIFALGWFHSHLLTFAAKWLDVGVSPKAADYVMVLPGGPQNRPFVAVAMVHAGLTSEILTAEVETNSAIDEQLTPPPDVVMRRTLNLRGIRDEHIHVLPGKSLSTWTDAVALRDFLQDHPDATVAIVTDGYHTRRSRSVFQRVLRSAASRVFFISAANDEISLDSWWKSEKGLTTYLSEFCKLAIYGLSDVRNIILVIAVAIVVFVPIAIVRRRRRFARK